MKKITFSKFPTLDYAGAEAFNTLSTNVSLCGANIHTVMLTSCHASEGKSFTSMHIAKTLADLGHNVVLVDADLRRSVLNSRYGVIGLDSKSDLGMVHYLAGLCEAQEIVYSTNIEGLYFAPIGRTVMNSLALLNNSRMSSLFSYLRTFAEYIIVDAPPAGVIIDAAEIARYCDGTLFVVGYNSVHRRELIDAKQQIERTGCPILGVSLNNVEFNTYSSKNYYYKSYYSTYTSDYYQSSDKSKPDVRKKRRGTKQ